MNRKHYKRQSILERDNYKCQYCGKPTTGIDHIMPVSFKDDNSNENLVVCCNECNGLASNFLFRDFIAKKNYILDQRLKKKKGFTDPLVFPSFEKKEKKKEKKKRNVKKYKFKRIFKREEDKRKPNYIGIKKLEEEELQKSVMAICKKCGKSFIQTRDWQKFCSNLCRKSYHRAYPNIEKRLTELESRVDELEEKIK